MSMYQSLVPWDNGHGTRNAREEGGFQLLFILQFGAMTILVTAPEMQEGILHKFILMFMSVFQSSTELAHVVPPLMGQVLGKVLLTSWEIN